jgi:myo-inositol catabolism protein IolC
MYILAFDHRGSFKKLFPEADLKEYKKIIFEGFLTTNNKNSAILVDEELGSEIITEAKKKEIPFFFTLEKSGQPTLELEYEDTEKKLQTINPYGAKILIRYQNPFTEKELEKLKYVSDICEKQKIPFLLEILAPEEQRVKAVQEAMNYNIKPRFWKMEGGSYETMKNLSDTVDSSIVVLGRGAEEEQVKEWISIAAPLVNVIGFAVGRTIFCPPLEKYYKKTISREEAVTEVAQRFQNLIETFEKSSKVS